MARKVKLANIVIENLRSQTSENKSLKLKKEKQMNALKAGKRTSLLINLFI